MCPDGGQSCGGLMALSVAELTVKPSHQAEDTLQAGCMRHCICQGCPKPDQIRIGSRSLHHVPPGLWGCSSNWQVVWGFALTVQLQCLHHWLNACLRSATLPHVTDSL
ncbi:TPA: hypothetical protein ACH3X1_016825 [Trebouxia sp. C0004]